MSTTRDIIEQFAWEPTVAGAAPQQASHTVVGGMGGSHLAADLLALAAPGLGLSSHHDYGLPMMPSGAIAIAVSHSGNTQETLDFARAAHAQGVSMAAISCGGALIEFAASQSIAHIVLPQSTLQPRACVGYHAVALLTLMGRTQELAALRAAAATPPIPLNNLAAHMAGGVPLIYSSAHNTAIAQYIKVQINESAKMPAFVNTFPELNHNEMAATLSDKTSRPVIIRDPSDDPRVIKRMDAFASLARERGIVVESAQMQADPWQRLVAGVVLGQELAAALARERGVDADDSSAIEDFKKRIA